MIIAKSGDEFPIICRNDYRNRTYSVDKLLTYAKNAGYNSVLLLHTVWNHSREFYVVAYINVVKDNDDIFLYDEGVSLTVPHAGAYLGNNPVYASTPMVSSSDESDGLTGRGSWTFISVTFQSRIYYSMDYNSYEPIFYTDLSYRDIYINNEKVVVPKISNGGGTTHIAKVTGQLSSLSNNLSDILMVSGGGGGGMLIGDTVYEGADAGGISGSGSNSANQSTGNAFGQGESGTDVSGGGSGLYGGYSGRERLSGIYAPSKIGDYQLALPLNPETLYNGNNIINYAHGSFDSYFDTYGDYLPNATTVLMDNEYMTLTCTVIDNSYQRIDILVKANSQTYQLIETQSGTVRDQIPAGVYFIVNENTNSIRCGTVLDDGWYLRLRQSSVYNYSNLYNAIVNSIPVVMCSAGAGSGYIGNALVSNKKMVGYNVPTSDATGTKTESVQVYSASGEENKPKAGNGMARITFLRSS